MKYTKKEKVVLFSLTSIQFMNIVNFMIMMPMGDILQKYLNINSTQFGWLISAYVLSAGLSSILGVFYLDNLPRKNALLYAYIGFIIGTLSSAIIPITSNNHLNYILLLITRIFTGITGGLLTGLILSIVADIFSINKRGKAMSYISLAFAFASIMGIPLALYLIDIFSNNWHVPFYMISITSLPILIIAYYVLPSLREHIDTRIHKFNPFETLQTIISNSILRIALLFPIFLVLGQFSIVSFLTPYLINNVQIAQSHIKYIYLIGGITTLIGSIFIGKSVDKKGSIKVFYFFGLASFIIILIFTNLPKVDLWKVLILSSFFFLIITGRMITANTIISNIVDNKNRAGFMSLSMGIQNITAGIAAAIAGIIIFQETPSSPLQNYNTVGYFAALCTCLALYAVFYLEKISKNKIE